MGLVLAKSTVVEGFGTFGGLSYSGVLQFWTSFNQISDGFAITPESWLAICWESRAHFGISLEEVPAEDFKTICEKAFKIIDTDKNALVDALEVMAILCVLSHTSQEFKVNFLFAMYDFDFRAAIALDELSLLIKTTSTGLLKICESQSNLTPADRSTERIAQLAFEYANLDVSARIERDDYVSFCLKASPEVQSWLRSFEIPSISDKIRNRSESGALTSSKFTTQEQRSNSMRLWEEDLIDLQPSHSSSIVERKIAPPITTQVELAFGLNPGVGVRFVNGGADCICPASSVINVLPAAEEWNNLSKPRIFHQHSGSISKLSVHHDGKHVCSFATPSILHENPELYVWNSETLQIEQRLYLIPGFVVEAMNFSRSGNETLAVSGRFGNENPLLFIFRWQESSSAYFSKVLPDVGLITDLSFVTTCAERDSLLIVGDKSPVPLFLEHFGERCWGTKACSLSCMESKLKVRQFGINALSVCTRSKEWQGIPIDQDTTMASSNSLDDTQVYYTAGRSGDILEWQGVSFTGKYLFKAHDGPISALTWLKENATLISCGESDGLVKIHPRSMESTLAVISLNDVQFQQPLIFSAVSSQVDGIIMVETVRGIVKVHSSDKEVFVRDRLCIPSMAIYGYCASPTQDQNTILAVLTDGSAFDLWTRSDVSQTFRLNCTKSLQSNTSSPLAIKSYCDFSSSGEMFVVVTQRSVSVFRLESKIRKLATIKDFPKSSQPIFAKFSPDCSLIAIVTVLGLLIVYNIDELRFDTTLSGDEEIGTAQAICKGKVSTNLSIEGPEDALLSMDFSTDSQFIRFQASSWKKIFHVDTTTMTLVESPSSMKDIEWETWTCTFSWGFHGGWPELGTRSSYGAVPVAASRVSVGSVDASMIGFSDGLLELALWPWTERNLQAHLKYQFHGIGPSIKGLTCLPPEVDNRSVTVRVQDKNVLWILRLEALHVNCCSESEAGSKLALSDETGKALLSPQWTRDIEKQNIEEIESRIHSGNRACSLQLQWVYGYSYHLPDVVHYVLDTTRKHLLLLYAAGNIVVAFDKKDQTQRHFVLENAPLTAFGAAPENFVACGDKSGRLTILDVESMSAVASIHEPIKETISLISFNRTGKIIAVIHGQEKNKVSVFDWRYGTYGFSGSNCFTGKILCARWSPDHDELLGICGETSLYFLLSFKGKNPSVLHPPRRTELVEKNASFSSMTWVTCTDSSESREASMFVADFDGAIYATKEPKHIFPEVIVPDAHRGQITFLEFLVRSDGTSFQTRLLFSAGIDCFIKIWQLSDEGSLSLRNSIDTSLLTASLTVAPSITSLSIAEDGFGNRKVSISIGNALAQILQLDADTATLTHEEEKPITQGHVADQICALAASPVEPNLFCTVAADSWLNLFEHAKDEVARLVARIPLEAPGRSCAFSSCGRYLAIGMTGSSFAVFELDFNARKPLSQIFFGGDSGSGTDLLQSGVFDIKFNPTVSLLGVATSVKIFLFSFHDKKLEKIRVLDEHSASITAFDFSFDSTMIRSIDTKGSVKYTPLSEEKPDHLSTSVEEIRWATFQVAAGRKFEALYRTSTIAGQLLSATVTNEEDLCAFIASDFPGTIYLTHFPVDLSFDLAACTVCPNPTESWTYGLAFTQSRRERTTKESESGEAVLMGINTSYECGSDLLFMDGSSGCISRWVVGAFKYDLFTQTEKIFQPVDDWEHCQEFFEEPKILNEIDSEKDSKLWLERISRADWTPSKNHMSQKSGVPSSQTRPKHIFGLNPCTGGAILTSSGRIVCGASRFAFSTNISDDVMSQVIYDPSLPQSDLKAICSIAIDDHGNRCAISRTGSHRLEVWDLGTACLLTCAEPSPSQACSRWSRFVQDERLSAIIRFSPTGCRLTSAYMSPARNSVGIAVFRSACVGKQIASSGWSCPELLQENWFVHPFHRVCSLDWVSDDSFVVVGETLAAMYLNISSGKSRRVEICLPTPDLRFLSVGSSFQPGEQLSKVFLTTNFQAMLEICVLERNTSMRFLENICNNGAVITTIRVRQNDCLVKKIGPANGRDRVFGTLIITGDSRGQVKLWTENFRPLSCFKHEVGLCTGVVPVPLEPCIASIHVSKDLTRSLITTWSGDIFLHCFGTGNLGFVTGSHGNHTGRTSNKVLSLSVSPVNPSIVATVGDSGLVYLWNLDKLVLLKRQQKVFDTNSSGKALAWSPDGLLLACGLGRATGSAQKGSPGTFLILNPLNLEILFQGRDSAVGLRALKFSPDGRVLAVVDEEDHLFLYDAKRGFKLIISNSLRSENDSMPLSPNHPLAIDFTENSMFLRLTKSSFNAQLVNATSCEALSREEELQQNVSWDSYNSILSWGLQGFWDEASLGLKSGESVGSIPTSSDVSHDLTCAVAGKTSGVVELSHYPCIKTGKENNQTIRTRGHVGPVREVRFCSPSGDRFVSVGEEDSTLVLWYAPPKEL